MITLTTTCFIHRLARFAPRSAFAVMAFVLSCTVSRAASSASSPSVTTPEAAAVATSSYKEARATGKARLAVWSIDPANYEAEIFRAFLLYLKAEEGFAVDAVWHNTRNDFRRTYDTVRAADSGTFGLSHVSILPRRRTEIAFSLPIIRTFPVLFSHRDAPVVDDTALFADPGAQATLVVAARKLDYFDNDIVDSLRRRHGTGLRVLELTSREDMKRLVLNDHRYYTYDDLIDLTEARAAGAPLVEHPAGRQAEDLQAFILPLDSDWQPVLDRFLAAFRLTPEYSAILDQKIGPDAGAKLGAR